MPSSVSLAAPGRRWKQWRTRPRSMRRSSASVIVRARRICSSVTAIISGERCASVLRERGRELALLARQRRDDGGHVGRGRTRGRSARAARASARRRRRRTRSALTADSAPHAVDARWRRRSPAPARRARSRHAARRPSPTAERVGGAQHLAGQAQELAQVARRARAGTSRRPRRGTGRCWSRASRACACSVTMRMRAALRQAHAAAHRDAVHQHEAWACRRCGSGG